MAGYDIKGCLDLLDRHLPDGLLTAGRMERAERDPTLRCLGLRREQVMRALGTKPRQREPKRVKGYGLHAPEPEDELPMLRRYLREVRRGAAGYRTAMEVGGLRLERLLHQNVGTILPTVKQMEAFVDEVGKLARERRCDG